MTQAVKIIEAGFLGRFRLTSDRRPPAIGEWYLCEKIPGVAVATTERLGPRHILEKVGDFNPVRRR